MIPARYLFLRIWIAFSFGVCMVVVALVEQIHESDEVVLANRRRSGRSPYERPDRITEPWVKERWITVTAAVCRKSSGCCRGGSHRYDPPAAR